MEKGSERELVLLRTKLEQRTWMLRLVLGLLISMIGGLVVHFLTNCG